MRRTAQHTVRAENQRLRDVVRELETKLGRVTDKVEQLESAEREREQRLSKAFANHDAGIRIAHDRLTAVEFLAADATAVRAQRANDNAIDVPPMIRDTSDGDDQATEPVMTLPEADRRGLLDPRDPTHVPNWVEFDGERTQETRIPEAEPA